MCEGSAGAAGTPRVARPLPLIAGFFVPRRIFPDTEWDTNRIRTDYDRLRTRYEQDTTQVNRR